MRGIRKWMITVGILAGLLVWVYDYEFFLNAGGPATPISIAILKACGLAESPYPINVFWPLCALVIAGAILGFGVAECVRHIRR